MARKQEGLVSVILPTYQRINSLERAIRSVINQTCQQWELIIIDDNGKGTEYNKMVKELVKKYEAYPVRYVENVKNSGGGAARNVGIRQAKGKFVAFLDDDDVFFPTKLAVQVKALSATDKTVGGITCKLKCEGASAFTRRKRLLKSMSLYREALLNMTCPGFTPSLVLKKEIFDSVGLFDESFVRHQDIEFLVRFSRMYSLICVDQSLVDRRKSDHSNKATPEQLEHLKESFLRKFKQDIEQFPLEHQQEIYQINWLKVCENYLKHHNLKRAKHFYRKANAYKKVTTRQNIALLSKFFLYSFRRKKTGIEPQQ